MQRFERSLKTTAMALAPRRRVRAGWLFFVVAVLPISVTQALETEFDFQAYAEPGKLFYLGYSNSSCEGSPSLETHLFAALRLSGIRSYKVTTGPDVDDGGGFKPCVQLEEVGRKARASCRREIAEALGVQLKDIQSILVKQNSKYETRIVVTTSRPGSKEDETTTIPATVCSDAFQKTVSE